MANEKILVVDDDKNICELLRLYLEKEGFAVTMAYDGNAALQEFEKLHPDLVLLDVMMPGMDGWEVCRRIRQDSKTPIIMLTAKGETYDKVLGLELGADDYIVKPFETKEVTARIKAVLRRSGVSQPAQTLTAGGVSLDHMKHTVTAEGKPVNLTLKEYELLRFLMEHPQTAFDRETLLKEVWSQDYFGGSRTVDVHIQTLRQKLGDCADRIETIRGLGYRFRGNTP